MKKKVLFPIVSVLLLFAAACSDDDKKQDEPAPPVPEEPAPEPEKVTVNLSPYEQQELHNINAVGQEMFQYLCADASVKGKNIAFSPLAANLGLSYISNMSLHEDIDPWYEILCLYGCIGSVESVFDEIKDKFPKLDSKVKLNFAGALWCDQDFYDNTMLIDLLKRNIEVVVVEPPKTGLDETITYYVNGWLAEKLDNTHVFFGTELGQNATIASALKIEADWAESTESVGTGLLLQYRDKAQVLKGQQCYAVRVPLGSNGSYEAVVVKANPGIDIDDVIASGEVFSMTGGEFVEQPFTVGFPVGSLTTSPNLPFDKVMAKLVEKHVPSNIYEEAKLQSFITVLRFYALGSLSFGSEGMVAGGSSVAQHTSRSANNGVESGFINIADGNCVLFVNETSTGTCLFAARIAGM